MASDMKTILVTGARGTVGHYVVGLAEAAGHRVIASDISAQGVLVPVRGEVRPADLRDSASLPDLVRGVDAVIHTAALMDVSADDEALSEVNTLSVMRLYEAASEAGAKRFVHMSSAMLYAGGDEPVDEEAELQPRGPYGRSKRGAEVYFEKQAPDGAPWTILRAAPMYGPRGRHFAGTLLAIGPLLALGTEVLPRPTGGPRGTMVHAEDVARALLFVLDRPEAHRAVFNVSDDDAMTLADRIGVTFDAYGLPSEVTDKSPEKLFEIGERLLRDRPLSALGVVGWRTVVMKRHLKPALRPRFDEEVLELVRDPLVVDASRLRALGWEPRFARFEDGWRQVLRWYQAERWVPRY